jgi:hypothetical protein
MSGLFHAFTGSNEVRSSNPGAGALVSRAHVIVVFSRVLDNAFGRVSSVRASTRGADSGCGERL